LVCSARPVLIAGEGECAGETEMSERADDAVANNSTMLQNLLEFCDSGFALLRA
jgi:hypothetical protein